MLWSCYVQENETSRWAKWNHVTDPRLGGSEQPLVPQNPDLSSIGGERPVVKMKAGSGMQMPDATAPSCNSLLHITLSVNYVSSLQAVIRAQPHLRLGRSHLGLGEVTSLARAFRVWLKQCCFNWQRGHSVKLWQSLEASLLLKRWWYKKWGCNVC